MSQQSSQSAKLSLNEQQTVKSMLELVKEGNRLLRKQAIERYEVLQQLASEHAYESSITELLYEEISNLHADSDTLLNQLRILLEHEMDNQELLQVLIGTDIEEDAVEQVENPKFQIAKLILKEEANILAREELIEILKEDVELNKAARYRIVSEIYQMRNHMDAVKKEIEVFEQILLFNPRFKIIEALSKHPDGITIHQLALQLGKKEFEIMPIINELEQQSFIERKGLLLKQTLNQ